MPISGVLVLRTEKTDSVGGFGVLEASHRSGLSGAGGGASFPTSSCNTSLEVLHTLIGTNDRHITAIKHRLSDALLDVRIMPMKRALLHMHGMKIVLLHTALYL